MTEDSHDFIRSIIDEDIKAGKNGGRVHTRFPPEPNGYLHIGHAKSMHINFSIAEDYGGKCNLRFDDTNPLTEGEVFTESIMEDVKWLGYDWEDRLFFSSDYFDTLYEYALELINDGKAYVEDLSAEEIHEYRGNLLTPGRDSPYRSRSIEENRDLFRRMKDGEFKDGEKALRAKIDMKHPNPNMRDPVIYRIIHADHYRAGDKWCIYPTYDWAHGQGDSIEGVTHSLCTLEFENHRPVYEWFQENLGIQKSQQIEFARLNLSYTVMSKRKLKELVEGNHVNGWDDPRLPTLKGMRRRGYPPEAIREFCGKLGVAKVNSVTPIGVLEGCVRDHLNKTAPRFMGVLNPLKVTIENYPEDEEDLLEAVNNPEDPDAGTRQIPFSRELYIERDDFMLDPPKKFFRLAPGREVRFRYAYLVTCIDYVEKDGEVVELICRIDPASKGGNAPDGRKVKSTIHWVSAKHALDAQVNLYDRLFMVEDPLGDKDVDFKEHLNPESLEVLGSCKVEPALKNLKPLDRFQFERKGYFCVDPDTTDDKMVFNRTVGLRDSWARMQKK